MRHFFSYEFLSKNWSWFLIGLLATFSASMGVYRLKERHSFKNKKDFIAIQKSLDLFQEGYFLDIDALETIEKMISKHPELQSRFDFVLTQSYLSTGKLDKAVNYGQRNLKRTEELTSNRTYLYSLTSLLISQNKLGEALLNAERLEQDLKLELDASFEVLRAYNLLRIIFLSKEAGNEQRLKEAWSELTSLSSFEELKTFFTEGNVSLEDYIIEKNKD